MPGGNKSIRGVDNTNGFQKNPQNINSKGRPPSIRAQLKDLMQVEGKMTISADDIVKVNEDGSVVVKVTTQLALARKLEKWAVSNKGPESLKAIQMIMEQIDGKPMQPIEVTPKVNIEPKEWIDVPKDQ